MDRSGAWARSRSRRTLGERATITRHPLEVVIWQNEEGGTYGSRFVSGDVRIVAGAAVIARDTGTSFAYADIHADAPAVSDERFRSAIARSAKALGLSTRQLPSGAGHDAQSMARLGPMGMIFVPSQGGISHSPLELSTAADVTNGANVLLASLLALDAELA